MPETLTNKILAALLFSFPRRRFSVYENISTKVLMIGYDAYTKEVELKKITAVVDKILKYYPDQEYKLEKMPF